MAQVRQARACLCKLRRPGSALACGVCNATFPKFIQKLSDVRVCPGLFLLST